MHLRAPWVHNCLPFRPPLSRACRAAAGPRLACCAPLREPSGSSPVRPVSPDMSGLARPARRRAPGRIWWGPAGQAEDVVPVHGGDGADPHSDQEPPDGRRFHRQQSCFAAVPKWRSWVAWALALERSLPVGAWRRAWPAREAGRIGAARHMVGAITGTGGAMAGRDLLARCAHRPDGQPPLPG